MRLALVIRNEHVGLKDRYWTPQLYYKHRNGTYSALDGQGSVIYWSVPSSPERRRKAMAHGQDVPRAGPR